MVVVASSLSANSRVDDLQGQEFLPPEGEDDGGICYRWQVTEEALVSLDDPSVTL